LLTLHYDNGEKKYELQRTIPPGEQMGLNFADLIHRRVADRKGRMLPADLASGTYDLRDLNPGKGGQLLGSELALDTTLGQQARPNILRCCGVDQPYFVPDIDEILFLQNSPLDVQALDCTGTPVELSFDFNNWWSGDNSVAQVTYKNAYGAGPGLTTGYASGEVEVGNAGYCTLEPVQVQVPITVFQFVVQGNPFIFVGTDSHIVAANTYYATNGNGAGPQPPGGTCCGASSDTSDIVTVTNGNTPTIQFTTHDQSAKDLDRTLTFEYTLSSGAATSQQMNVTAREFAYATNNNPSNQCTLGYGTNRTYTYTIYTHPDREAVDSNSGLSGTPVTEGFNPALTCETKTGNGSLDDNGEFSDQIASLCSSAPLTCTQTSTQTISVAGYLVRTNTLQWTSTGVKYTSDGPTQ